MKACSRNRKRIAWLALRALDSDQEPELQAHLESCAGCRRYLEELTPVINKLRAERPNSAFEPSGTFHQKLVARLRAEESEPQRLSILWLDWRIALPAFAAAALLIGA